MTKENQKKNQKKSLQEKNLPEKPDEMHSMIINACRTQFGVLDSDFLCRSIGVLDPEEPTVLKQGAPLSEAIGILQAKNIGAALISDKPGKIIGIFSERDYLIKVHGKEIDEKKEIIDDYMTPNPMTVTADSPIAYGLSLISQGGFRHLPVVDEENYPVGIVTVRDVVDYIVDTFTDDLLSLKIDDVGNR